MDMDVWFVSDQHYHHANILKFTRGDGSLLRPEFSSVEDMNETMIARHNETVGQYQKIYFLGDICFNRTYFEQVMPRLNGKKRLILGNHDKFFDIYPRYFEKVMESWRPQRNLLFTHRPTYLNTEVINGQQLYNVHGHIHRGQINNPIYLNISVEETDYRPIHFEEIKRRYSERGIEI